MPCYPRTPKAHKFASGNPVALMMPATLSPNDAKPPPSLIISPQGVFISKASSFLHQPHKGRLHSGTLCPLGGGGGLGVVWGVGNHQTRRYGAQIVAQRHRFLFFILSSLLFDIKKRRETSSRHFSIYSAVSVISVSEQWTVIPDIVPQTPFESSYILCHISAVPA